MNQISDQSLIDNCLAGRREAFGQLVERYQNRLFHSLVHLLGSTEDAQDAAQDAFVQAFEKLGSFRGQSQFYSWLFRIAFNTAVSHKRKTRRMSVSLEARKDATGVEPSDANPSTEPSYALGVSDRQRLVQQALSELSDEFRTALVLKEMDGMSYEEIAELVEVPVGTVRSRIHRARIELRDKLSVLLKSEVL
ncbi:sigma-70 family RNA polymerase sigma factor [Schlesneria sp. T3-172]|uniref:sigma-70 family RNA polymerase sigma factor n=1 Tax=Schlesneria sphaerica TaxID=3373610 RepID=UPI0037C581F8